MELAKLYPEHYSCVAAHDLWGYPMSMELRTGKEAPNVPSLIISSEIWQWKRNLKRIRFARPPQNSMMFSLTVSFSLVCCRKNLLRR